MQAQLIYCPRCGAPNGNLHGFCGRCGQVLGPRPQAATYRPPQPAAPYRPPAPRPQAPATPYRPQGPRPQQPAPGYRPPASPGYAPPPGYQPRDQGAYAPNRGDGPSGQGLAGRAPAPARIMAPQMAGAGGGAAAAAWGAAQSGVYHPGSFGYPVARAPHAATGARRHHWGLWATAGSLVALILVGLLVIGIVAAIKPQPSSCTGPGCGAPPPPKGAPLAAPHTYTSSTYHYTVRYYDTPGGYNADLASAIHVTKQTATGIDWSVDLDGFDPAGGTWPYGIEGMSAGGQSAQQVVQGVVNQDAQGGQLLFAIPNAMVGFVHGYGAVYDVQAQASSGGVIDARYIVMAAVHDGLAVVFTALGPFNPKTQEHPDPTDTTVSVVVAPLVNGVTFPGMPVR